MPLPALPLNSAIRVSSAVAEIVREATLPDKGNPLPALPLNSAIRESLVVAEIVREATLPDKGNPLPAFALSSFINPVFLSGFCPKVHM